MHLDNGLAAPCMASVHGAGWVGGGRGHGLFPLACDVIIGGVLHEMDLVFVWRTV